MYIRYNNKPYLENNNLREILQVSGEVISGENTIEITEEMITILFDDKNNILFDIVNNLIIEKTLDQKKIEKLSLVQGYTLGKLIPAAVAMSSQTVGNIVKEKLGKDTINEIEDNDIEIICEYLYKIAIFDKTFIPANHNIEDINEHVFNGGITLPEVIAKYINE